jgi:hypothetical protein
MPITKSSAMSNALAFARDGHAVLPLHGIINRNGKLGCTCGDGMCTSPGKHPHPRLAPHGLKDATTDISIIRSWFSESNCLNYGVSTDNLFTIDVDLHHDGDETWRALEKKHGAVPQTWRVLTGSGGEHILFEMPSPPLKNTTGKLGQGVDTRGLGGYIVGAGCKHVLGNSYCWEVDHHPNNTKLVLPPDWIVTSLGGPKLNGGPRSPDYYDSLIAQAIEGERNSRVASLVGHLRGAQIRWCSCSWFFPGITFIAFRPSKMTR